MKKLLVLLLVVSLVALPPSVQALSISPDATIGTSDEITCSSVSPTTVLNANSKRRSFLIVAPPTNTATVYVGFSNTMTIVNGIPLNANNSLSDSTYVGAVYCLVESGTAKLIASETKR